MFIDNECPAVDAAFVETSKAVRTMANEAGLDRLLVELVNLRVSQINRCAYCLDVHAVAATGGRDSATPRSPARLARDRIVLTARAGCAHPRGIVTELPATTHQDAAYAFAQARLRRDEVAAIVWIAVTMNGFNRISILSRHPVRSALRPDSEAASD